MKSSVGFIGLGMMGTPMAARLQKAGFLSAVHNRTKKKASSLVEEGATWCESPKEVAEKSEIVFSMLSNSEALFECALGSNGVLRGARKGSVHVDMSTVSPAITKELGNRYRDAGCFFLHSPVLGSVPQATDGSLLLFVGGNEGGFLRAEPALKTLGSRIWRFDQPEQASHMKLLCNMFIAGMGTTLAQALVFAEKANVDPIILLDVLNQSALNAPMYQTKGKSMLDRNFAPRFFVEHMLKDLNLMLQAGKELNVALPSTEVAQRLFSEAADAGFSKEDYSAVIKVLERRAGIEVGKK
jgi:3-hydroxyisobutyrate dehydrogenase-like beta-hydroxyacid dehydrogenase